MSITMIPVQSSYVRAIGNDSEHARILVQFDNGTYECVYHGFGGSTKEGRRAHIEAVFRQFEEAASKGRFYHEQIRRQVDVWKVRKLADMMVEHHTDGRRTIEPDQVLAVEDIGRVPREKSGTERLLEKEAQKSPVHQKAMSESPTQESQAGTIKQTPTLILTVGLPRSGKSTWSRGTGLPVVSPDAVRLALHGRPYVELAEPLVWAIVKTMVRALFLTGHETVILDACNVSRKRRDEWQSEEWATVFQVFEATREECIKRAANGSTFQEINDTVTADLLDAIERMSAAWEPLGEGEKRFEGFDLGAMPASGFFGRGLADFIESESHPRDIFEAKPGSKE